MDSATKEYVYTRHDNKQFYLKLQPIGRNKYNIWAKLLSAQERPSAKAVSIDCNAITFSEQKNGRKVKVYIELEPKVLVERDEFYRKVEFENGSEENSREQFPPILRIDSIYKYIYVINIYNCISAMVRVYSILSTKENLPEENEPMPEWKQPIKSIKMLAMEYINAMLEDLPFSGDEEEEDGAQDFRVYNSQYEKLMDDFISKLSAGADELQRAVRPSPYQFRKIWDLSLELKSIINQYHQGNLNFFYCRGVGRVIYPEIPRIFRGNRRHEEDKFYRTMKASFPEEFHRLKYLDRLAKMQHYELPTRMLDITSNPLVALYMSCNKIYTGDLQQLDYGEVILYFNHTIKNRSYDSKTMLIVAALVKLSYTEKTLMYKFLMMLEQYFLYAKKELMFDVRKYVNTCVHIAADRGVDTWLTQEEKGYLTNLAALPADTAEPLVSPFDFCWACLHGIRRPKKDSRWRRLNSSDSYENDYDEELAEGAFRQMFEQFISAYERLLLTVRRENPAFQNKINIFTLLKSYPGQFGMSNPRIQAQAGGFILAGLDHRYINDQMLSTRGTGSSGFQFSFPRIIITNKKEIYRQLQMLNITDATMLPDLTHKANYLDNQIQ